MKKYAFVIFPFLLGRLFYYIFPKHILYILKRMYVNFYTGYKTKKFRSFGIGSQIYPHIVIRNPEQLSVGKKTIIRKGLYLTMYNADGTSLIKIGDNCDIGENNQITSYNNIEIGDGLLTGKYVIITDNSHGKNTEKSELMVIPHFRQLYSKGGIKIGKNVWIGDKATILANVTIGDSVIIGANTVVTKDIPSFSIAVGNPMKIINRNLN